MKSLKWRPHKNVLDAGHYVWNAGIFLYRASTMLAEAKNLAPDMLAAVQAAVDGAREDNNFWHIDDAAWAKFRVSRSITPF